MDGEQLEKCQRSTIPAFGLNAKDEKKCCLKRRQAKTERVVSGLTFACSEFYLSIIKLDHVIGFVFMLTPGMIFAFT